MVVEHAFTFFGCTLTRRSHNAIFGLDIRGGRSRTFTFQSGENGHYLLAKDFFHNVTKVSDATSSLLTAA